MIDQRIFEDLQTKIDEETTVRDVSDCLGPSEFCLCQAWAEPSTRLHKIANICM